MVLDGRSIVDKRLVTFNDEYPLIDTERQIQPNGIDLRVEKIYYAKGKVTVPRQTKVVADMNVLELEAKDAHFDLEPRTLYWVDFLETIYVADGYCAQLITRSSLVRAGLMVFSGLWDTGFSGRLGCTIQTAGNPIAVEWGAALCQVLFSKAEFNGHRYSGRYQGTSQTELAA